jgi:hypothetical protein
MRISLHVACADGGVDGTLINANFPLEFRLQPAPVDRRGWRLPPNSEKVQLVVVRQISNH